MAKLFTLLFGKSKQRMRPIMTDVLHKCENYRDARQHVKGHHNIVEADSGVDKWRKKSATVGCNRCERVQIVGRGPSGYIGKNGFNQHT